MVLTQMQSWIIGRPLTMVIEDVKESGRPMEIIGSKSALPLEEKNLLLKLLKDYGATPA